MLKMNANQFEENHPPGQSALEAWQTSKMTSNLPKLGLISLLLLSTSQKAVGPKIPENLGHPTM